MAQQRGIDYSFSRPPVATIAALGYTTVGRYLASSSGKRLSGAEATSLHGAGLSIFLVFEDFANPLDNWGGVNISTTAAFNGGVADATQSVGQANALGVPADRPIYVAMDFSQPVNNFNLYDRLAAYMNGWATTIGVNRVGLYGGGPLWSNLFTAGYVSGYFWQAAAASWSNYEVPYPGAVILQGLGNAVPGYSADPDTCYTIDFGQWPNASQIITPPAPHTGATLIANVGNNSSYAQPDKQTLITPNESHDQVIYSVTTTDATLATGSHNTFYEIPTKINQTAYPIGTFSFDGGVTFNDFGFQLPVIPGGTGVYPAVTLQPVVDSVGNIFFNGVNNSGSTKSLIINVALLASYAPSRLPVGSQNLGQKLSYTNVYPKLTSDQTTRVYSSYRRIAEDSASGTGNVTIAHGQNGIPNIMFWVNVGGNTTINPIGWQSTGSIGALGIKMDANNLYFHVDAGTYNNAYYRVYKDN